MVRGDLGIARDVWDSSHPQAQLRQAQKLESIVTLAGGIAHDFYNQLQVVLGYADIMIARKDKQSIDPCPPQIWSNGFRQQAFRCKETSPIFSGSFGRDLTVAFLVPVPFTTDLAHKPARINGGTVVFAGHSDQIKDELGIKWEKVEMVLTVAMLISDGNREVKMYALTGIPF